MYRRLQTERELSEDFEFVLEGHLSEKNRIRHYVQVDSLVGILVLNMQKIFHRKWGHRRNRLEWHWEP